ncbi:hydrogenase 4, membrane subunit HyfF [Escherichia coli]|nr:hydrogenase 4, membrane subunit HyfF [Escherichia coli]
MSYSVMFALLLLTPLLFSLLCFACRKRGLSATCTVTVLHSLGITLLLILALWVVQTAADAGEIFAAGLWLHIDGLGGLFLAILGVIGFLTGVYSIGYMRHEVAHGELSPVTLCDYYGFFHLFLFTMLLVVTSNNLIVMWAAIEATTLS